MCESHVEVKGLGGYILNYWGGWKGASVIVRLRQDLQISTIRRKKGRNGETCVSGGRAGN